MRIATVNGHLQRVVIAASCGDRRFDPVIPRDGPEEVVRQGASGTRRVLVLWKETRAIGKQILVVILNKVTSDIAYVRGVDDRAETQFMLDPQTIAVNTRDNVVRVI